MMVGEIVQGKKRWEGELSRVEKDGRGIDWGGKDRRWNCPGLKNDGRGYCPGGELSRNAGTQILAGYFPGDQDPAL